MNQKPSTGVHATASSIADAIEGHIIFGKLSPGFELVEDALMDDFGAKRHVVRSAIADLVGRGIVAKQRGHSARVRNLTRVEADELYHMRGVLQREAVRIMPLPAAPSDMRDLHAIHAEYEAALDSGAAALRIHRLNDLFHARLFALCRNALLCDMIEALNRRSAPIRSHGIVRADWLAQARQEHAAMIAALEQGDRATLLDLVVDHMMPARQIWEQTHQPEPAPTPQGKNNHDSISF